MFPAKTIAVACPYKRKNKELAKLVATSFMIKPKQYLKHQLPDPFTLPSGQKVAKPARW